MWFKKLRFKKIVCYNYRKNKLPVKPVADNNLMLRMCDLLVLLFPFSS